MEIDGDYLVLIEEASLDDSTPQLELKDGVATWKNEAGPPGTYEAQGETVVISFEIPAAPGFAIGRQTIVCTSMGEDYLSGDMIDTLNEIGAVEEITLTQYVALIRVGSVSEAQVIDAERDPGISWAALQEMEDLVDEAESRTRH